MKTVGLISYQFYHLKTEQLVLRLPGKFRMKIYALPLTTRPTRQTIVRHRPNQAAAAHPEELCRRFDLDYVPVEADTEIDNSCDCYFVAGEGILSGECVRNRKIERASRYYSLRSRVGRVQMEHLS